MKKILVALLCVLFGVSGVKATVLLKDSLNYPYTNGCIEGQGQWFCYSPASPYLDALVTNNVLILNTANHDSVATPTNGFYTAANGTVTWATFTLNVNQIPSSTNGGYFCQFQATNGDNVCHIFIDTIGTTVPGTYRLGIANFATSISVSGTMNYPMDLATGVTYTVVIAYDKFVDSPIVGANLWVNPTAQDITNAYNGSTLNIAYGTDTTSLTNLLDIDIAQIGFSPYVDGGVSNVIAGTTYADVATTNLPAFGIQPQSSTNYSGNSLTLYGVASGADVTYQWFSPNGPLTDDGVNVIGSTTDALLLNNISGSTAGNYYVVATDAYGNFVSSSNAYITVITTPTPPFFPTNVVALSSTNNLFTSTGFTNTALGTGPLYYQWYFAPTNAPTVFSPLPGQNSAAINFFLQDYTFAGNYFVIASNSVNGGSVAVGPTNSITEIAPVTASLAQLHNFEISIVQNQGASALKGKTVYINTNNVIVSGYVTTYGGFGSSYTEYNIQDASGYGVEVYLGGSGNTHTPPVGSYVTVTGPVEIYDTELELAPAALSAIVTNAAPVIALEPKLANAEFNDLATNALGTNALLTSMSLVTFTNVYLYGTTNGGAFGTGGSHSGVGGIFLSNYYTVVYFTVGAPYSAANTNVMEIYQFAYSYPNSTNTPNNPFYNQTIPTYCYQLTGAYEAYNGGAELAPSRPADYVVNPPGAYSATLAVAQKKATVSWPEQTGSTYSVYSSTNLAGPWTTVAYGLTYFPTNATLTDTNYTGTKFYRVSSP